MKKANLISLFVLLVMMLSALSFPAVALAQEEPAQPADNITLSTEFPKLDAIATGSFSFNVELLYRGQKERTFDLKLSGPQGWETFLTPQYETGKRISSVALQPAFGSGKSVTVTAAPTTFPLPEPGEYKINLETVSGNVSGKIELVARITAKYSLAALPVTGLYNTTATAGRDNVFSIELTNIGTAAIDNVGFTPTKPEGWEIKFTPEKIEKLNPLDPKNVDINIKPPPKTVAGDYMITIRSSGTQASADKIDVRVRVETPTIWGWVGVIIIIVVVVFLIVIFMRFGRR